MIANYNDIESVKEHFKKHKDIAGIIIEPVGGNMGVVVPEDGFLQELKDLTHKNGCSVNR